MDWIGNNLYWTDAIYARIEVMDLDTMQRMELLRTGGNTIPRAIVVDPSTRWAHEQSKNIMLAKLALQRRKLFLFPSATNVVPDS